MGDALGRRGDPGERDRTTSLDEPTDDVERVPRIVVVVAAIVVFGVGLANFAFGQVGLGVAAVSIGLLVFGAGLSWLTMERRRIRQAERDWLINHPAP
jgi:hypothetical protein